VRRGDIVQLKGDAERSEVVRDVSVVLHLANGMDEVYQVMEEVTMGVEEDVPPDELAALAAADAELRDALEVVKKPATGKAKK
jgi:hypothetical protein